MATASPAGVKTNALCGKSGVNNAEFYLPPYPNFVNGRGVAIVPSTCKNSGQIELKCSKAIDPSHVSRQ